MRRFAQGISAGAVLLWLALTAPAAAQSYSDKAFLETAAQGNVAEVELARLALEKTNNAEIRAFAQRMIHDHEMLEAALNSFVVQAGIQPPHSLNAEHRRLYDRLNQMTGDEFNKEYVADMDKDHHQDLAAYRKEIASTQDAALKAAVEAGEKVIREHVRTIDDIDRKMGMTPAST